MPGNILNNGRSNRGRGIVVTSGGADQTDPEIKKYQATPEYLAEIESKLERKYGKKTGKPTPKKER